MCFESLTKATQVAFSSPQTKNGANALMFCGCGDDVRKFEPKVWLKFKDLDKSIRELRAMFKQHPQWFEVPKPKSDKGQNAISYSVE